MSNTGPCEPPVFINDLLIMKHFVQFYYTLFHLLIVQDGEFIWDKTVQGHILGSFFWGYLITQIPGGWIATKFGGKRVFGWSMFATTLATLFTPVAANVSYIFLMVLRILVGIGSVSFSFLIFLSI